MKRIVRVIGVLVVVLLLAAVALPFLVNANQFRPRLEAELSTALGRDVRVGDLKLALLAGGVSAADLSIADDPAYSRTPFLYTRALTVGVELWPLITSRQLHVTELVLDQPQINLLQSAAGDWNFSSLGGPRAPRHETGGQPGAPMHLSVKLVKITNGHLSFAQHNSSAKARELGSVNVEVRDVSAAAAFPFYFSAKLVGGGDIRLNGSVGPLNPVNAAETPAKVKVKVIGFDLAAARIDSSAGLAGLVSIDGIAAANGKTLSVNGRLNAQNLQLAKNGSPAREPVEFDFEVDHDMRKNSGVLRRGAIHIGSAPASLTGTYAMEGAFPRVNMNLAGPEMSVPQLAAMLPAFGVMLPEGSSFQGGRASARLSFEGPLEALVTNGSLGLSNTRLAGFDLGSKMSSVERLAGIKTGPDTDIQTFVATVHWAPDGSTIQDIKLIAPAVGELNGGGTVSPSQVLDFKMRASLHTAALAVGVPFLIEGTAAHPVFRPDMRAMSSDVRGKAKGLLDSVLGKKK